jgi:hypothetical protein
MTVNNERKGDGKNWSQLNLGYCPSICLVGLKKTTKNISQDNLPICL